MEMVYKTINMILMNKIYHIFVIEIWSQDIKYNNHTSKSFKTNVFINGFIPCFFVPPAECTIRSSRTECTVVVKVNRIHRMHIITISMAFEHKIFWLSFSTIG